MPFIRITVLGPTLAAEQIQRLQQGTTDLMVAVMRKPVEGVAVLVEPVIQSAWSIAGRPMAVAAHVEATIAHGTNTPDEKAKFIAEMWTLLRSALGPELREETYIVCHEIDTKAYGRGGLTRAERDRGRQGGG
jgi:4-oxalocrotonate tautomerase